MIVLDTSVLSELLRAVPDAQVARWAAARPANSLYTTAVSQAEMLYGVALMPAGAKRRTLATAVSGLFDEDFAGRVWPFDAAAAGAYAGIAADRKNAGYPISQFDAQIAAIARTRGAVLATRNVADFAGCGIDIVNPWQ